MPTIERLALAVLILASLGSLGLAFTVQYGLGYAPCSLCVLARWPHAAVVVLGGLAFAKGWYRAGLGLAMAALLAAFAISLRHVGVEAGWLPLPDSCRVPDETGGLDQLRGAMLAQTQPACDIEGPSVLGLTMAAWHALAAATLALVAASVLSRGSERR
ncbi:MAG: disulfide bond formation protein B [Pseudomonadota bacterium]